MMPLPEVLLYSADAALAQRLGGALDGLAALRTHADLAGFESDLEGREEAAALVDLCSPDAERFALHLLRECPAAVVVAVGDPRGASARSVEAAGAFAVEPAEFELTALRRTVRHAVERAHLAAALRRARARAAVAAPAPAPEDRTPPAALRQFIRSVRPADAVDPLLRNVVESVRLATGTARAGVFLAGADRRYRLAAEQGGRAGTDALAFDDHDPFVRWLEHHVQMVVRDRLEERADSAAVPRLRDVLSALGAEIAVPLNGRGRLLGWLFLGRRATGAPFRDEDLEDLAAMAGHISMAIETAQLFQDTAMQSALAGTVFGAMPTGVVAVDAAGTVRWFNRAAGEILGRDPAAVLGRPAAALGSRVEDCLRAALAESGPRPAVEWIEQATRRAVSVSARRLEAAGGEGGAVLFIEDVTEHRNLVEKEERLARDSFWVDLAAGLSHEIRNPLVAVKTFAQLLPERYADAEFRGEFSRLVSAEVARIEGIVDQINRFAYPPPARRRRLAPRLVAAGAVVRARARLRATSIPVETDGAEVPDIEGDLEMLSEAVAALIENAVEALAGRADGRVRVETRRAAARDGGVEVAIIVRDNGPGIPAEIREKVLSPFATTKSRGMGLGLPIARRAVEDHGGRLQIETGPAGTAVTLFLPVAPPLSTGC